MLPAEMIPADGERLEIGRYVLTLRQLVHAVVPRNDAHAASALAGMLEGMFKSYPTFGASRDEALARSHRYMRALDDVPPWAVGEVIRRWEKGEYGDRDYERIPDSALMRRLAWELVEFAEAMADRAERVLAAHAEPLVAEPSEEQCEEMRRRLQALSMVLGDRMAGRLPMDGDIGEQVKDYMENRRAVETATRSEQSGQDVA